MVIEYASEKSGRDGLLDLGVLADLGIFRLSFAVTSRSERAIDLHARYSIDDFRRMMVKGWDRRDARSRAFVLPQAIHYHVPDGRAGHDVAIWKAGAPRRLVHGLPEQHPLGLDVARRGQRAAELLKPHGLRYGFHNHWWEFDKKFNGPTPYEVLLANAPDAFSELDTYWCAVAGDDPVRILKTYGKRVPVLHIKDGSKDRNDSMTAVGDGKMDWKSIIGAADENVNQWLIVELDRCATDMMEAVAKSCSYLANAGFGIAR